MSMNIQKTSLNIQVIFQGPQIKNQNNHSDHHLLQKSFQEQKQQKELRKGLRDGKIELIEQFPISQILNYKIMGRYKPIILQRLLRHLQEITNMSFQGHKISIYLSKPKMYLNCGNYPLKDNVLIRGKDYIQELVMTILAKKRGEIDLQPLPRIEARIRMMEKQKLKIMAQRREQGIPQLAKDENLDKAIQKRVNQKSENVALWPVQSQTQKYKNKSQKIPTRKLPMCQCRSRTPKLAIKQRPKSPPMDPLLKLKGNLSYLKQGISKFHSFIFSDVKQFYFPLKQYDFEVKRLQNLEYLRDESDRRKLNSGRNQKSAQKESPKINQPTNQYNGKDFKMDDEKNSNNSNIIGQQQKIQKKQPGRRLKERRIGNVIDKVVEWTRWAYNYRQKWQKLRPHQSQKYPEALSLQQAALIIDVPKKTLDDYLFHIQFGNQNRFNFNEHCMDRFAVLRMFVNKYKRQGKTNPVVVVEVNARKEARKRNKKIRKANQKRLQKEQNL